MVSLRQQSPDIDGVSLLGAVGLIQRSRQFSRPVYLTMIIGLGLLTLLLGLAAFFFTPPGGNAAIWWPAAGTGALLYLLYRGPRWQVFAIVGIITAAANVLIGRPPGNALWGFIVIICELAVLAFILGPQGRGALLSSVRGLLRFLAAVIVASVVAGVIGALAFVVLVNASPLATFAAIFPSHLSALVLIVPIALVPLPQVRESQRVGLVIQATVAALATAVIFAPFQSQSIAAPLFPLLAWAAIQFRPIVVTCEIVILGVLASALTVLGGGPYRSTVNGEPSAVLLQVFMLSMALTALSIIVVRSEKAELRAENQRRAGLLRGGFVGSQVGSMVVRADSGAHPIILEVNDVAAGIADPSWVDPLIAALGTGDDDDLSTEVILDNGRTIQVYGSRVPTAGGETVLGLQLVDISDFVAAQEEMENAVERERRVTEELRALSRQKDDFVSSVSHELRTPITSILGFAEELKETATPDQQQSADIILRNAQRLTEMVEQLLEIGRMTAPNPLREARTIDLTMIARDTIQEQSGIAHGRNVTIRDHLSADPTPVMASTNTAGRIVTNLLSNALKFTPPGGSVDITTASDGTTATLIVDDSGAGISDNDLPHVFERFFRSDDARKRLTPGTGLGLSIVRSLVQSHDGDISISRSPLGGARMVVTLPAAFDDTPRNADSATEN